MKKNRYLLSLALVVTMASLSFAQGKFELPASERPMKFVDQEATNNGFLGKKDVESGWLSPRQLAADYGATWTQPTWFRLFQDSSVFEIPSTQATDQSPRSNSFNLVGTLFQPDDPLYQLQTTGWNFTRFTQYDCDSVRFPFSYIRQVDSFDNDGTMTEIIDTLIIHFYQNENLNTTWFFNNSDEIFGIPIRNQFDLNKLAANDVKFTDTLLLDASAATDTVLGETITTFTLSFAVGDEVKSVSADNNLNLDNAIGLAITYKTGQPYSFGDTLVSFNDQIVPDKKMNIFGTGVYYNTGSRVIQTDHLNNSFVINRQTRYGQTELTTAPYIPALQSIGWGADFYFDGQFHVTGKNVGINDVQNKLGMSVYPNPASKGTTMNVSAENISSSLVNLVVMDVVGNVVYSSVENGSGNYSISTDNLNSGVYFVSLTADGNTSTQKVVITE